MTKSETLFSECASLLREADGILIGAGAGMGVDSGLPDFRGEKGFWKAYPALGRAGISFGKIANPDVFERDPRLAWGFYGHRLGLYRDTVPHEGFAILRDIVSRLPQGGFVYTSNVDGQFQRAGFESDRIDECHGSIHHLQCVAQCCEEIWSACNFEPVVDLNQCRLISALPLCPACGALARPNVLMFGDWYWLSHRQSAQARRFPQWLRKVNNLVAIELGAGTHIPSVRLFCRQQRCPVIRINSRDAEIGGSRGVSLKMGALEGMRGIVDKLDR